MKAHWIDNADSYICPVCGVEVSNPASYDGCECPICGFQDVRDNIVKKDVDKMIWWMNNDQLESCPFCGSQAYLKERYHGDNEKYYVFCSGCYTESFEYKNVHDAVEAWNKRVKV